MNNENDMIRRGDGQPYDFKADVAARIADLGITDAERDAAARLIQMMRAAIAALPAAPMGVKVNRLNWLLDCNVYTAGTPFGYYTITDRGHNGEDDRFQLRFNSLDLGTNTNLRGAKKNLQTDYELRIFACFAPTLDETDKLAARDAGKGE